MAESKIQNFNHLKIHSQFSICEGAIKIDDLNMKKIKSLNKKYHKITTDYGKQKSKHLERLTDKMLKNDEKAQQLKSKSIKGDFLKNF